MDTNKTESIFSKKRLFLSLFILISINLAAQRGSISGTVMDEAEKQKLVYVSAFLFDAKDSSFVKAELTDGTGFFKFDLLYDGQYYVQLFYSMYENWYSETLTLNSQQRNYDLGVIYIKQKTNLLGGVEVVYMKPLYEDQPGKLIMNVESHPTAAGDNLFELLRKTPSVTIDNDENILVNGKSGVNLLINNRPSKLSGEELINYLKTTPADMVDKIEIINSPSAKYDADGSAGMINIQIKRDDRLGFNGSVRSSASISKNFYSNSGVSLNFRAGKWIVSTNYNFGLRQYKSGSRTKTGYIDAEGNRISIAQNDLEEEFWSSISKGNSHHYSLYTEYQMNRKNSFGIQYYGGFNKGSSESANYTRFYVNESIDSSMSRVREGLNNSQRNYLSLFYRHDFDTAQSHYLELNFDYSQSNSKSENLNLFDYYYWDFNDHYSHFSRKSYRYPQLSNSYTLEAYYERNEGEYNFEAGIKNSLDQNDTKSMNYIEDCLIENMTDHYIYFENITAGYFSISTQLDKMTHFRAGIRGELSYIGGEQVTASLRNSSLYFDLFPTAQFNFTLPKKNRVNISYHSRISRPWYDDLNPFVDISEQLSISTGNPYLKPEYSQNFSLGYSWNYMLFFNVGYYYTINAINYARDLDPQTGITTRYPQNIGKRQGVNGNISFNIPLRKWWNLNLYTYSSYGKSVFTYQNKIETRNVYHQGLFFSQNFTVLKNYTLEMSGYYSLPSQGEWGKSKGTLSLNAGLRARLLNKKLTIGFSVGNILNNGSYSWNYQYPDHSTSEGFSIWNTRSYSLRISYNFGKYFEIKNKRLKSGSDGGTGQPSPPSI
jgi:outer membrane receptor protein involved in Fe transport